MELLIPDPAWPAAISHTWNLVWRLLSATSDDCSEDIEDTIHKSQAMFRASERKLVDQSIHYYSRTHCYSYVFNGLIKLSETGATYEAPYFATSLQKQGF